MNVKKKRIVKDKEVRVQEILCAAKMIFLKKGYQNTSVEAVAKKAKISKGALYQYFKNKDDLYYGLMFPMFDKLEILLKGLKEQLDNGSISSGGEFFQVLFETFMDLYEYDADAIRIYQNFQINGLFSKLSKTANRQLNQMGDRNYGLLRQLFKRGAAIHILKETEAIVLADIVWAMFLGVLQVEENKLRYTTKDHTRSTLKKALKIVALGIERISEKPSASN